MLKKTDLTVMEPVKIEFTKKGKLKRIDKECIKEFKERPCNKNIMNKQGVYVFALKAGRGFKPWYVGMASKSFGQEIFTTHKTTLYNDLLFAGKKGTPWVFFITTPAGKNKISKPIITSAEKEMIQYAYAKNPLLLNTKGTKGKSWGIKGLIRGGSGKKSESTKQFGKMMGLL
jgi:hypothetical protein